MADIVYTSSATAQGGREGHVKSDDATIDLDLVKPGSKKEGSNPEQLFAAGYASCFDGALNLMAEKAKKKLTRPQPPISLSLKTRLTEGFK